MQSQVKVLNVSYFFLAVRTDKFSKVFLYILVLYLDNLSVFWSIASAAICGVVCGIVVQIFVVPLVRRIVQSVCDRRVNEPPTVIVAQVTPEDEKKQHETVKDPELGIGEMQFHSQVQLAATSNCCNRQDTEAMFSSLQILTAIFGSFQHGGNDVSNAVGPVIALWVVFSKGSVYESMGKYSSISILFVGGLGMAVGLWIFGRRVIETIGSRITKIRPSTGFTIELGSALTVLTASKLGLPVSTTHCQVGSVVFVGYADGSNQRKDLAPGEKVVNWKLFGTIFLSWIVTIPAAMGCSAVFTYLLYWIFL